MSPSNSQLWKTKHLIIFHLLSTFLVFSVFYLPLYNYLWKAIDTQCFYKMAGLVTNSPFWQDFWAVANHRIGDVIEDVFFIIFFLWLMKITPRGQKLQKSAEFFFMVLLTVAVVLFVNNFLFRQNVHIVRHSPSLELTEITKLANLVSWIKVKGGSKASFPSDHATTALLFICNFLYLSRNKFFRFCVCFYGAFLCCPRMVAGAHWLTDIICGSSSVVLIVFSWAFCTPFASFCIKNIYALFVKIASVCSRQFSKEIP
jgi:membrane-associated phospholipid phosphatase